MGETTYQYLIAIECLFLVILINGLDQLFSNPFYYFVMFRLVSLIIYAMVLFMLTNCCNKTNKLKNAEIIVYKDTSNAIMIHKMNTSCRFIDSIIPGETTIEERQMQGGKTVKKRNTNISVYFLLQDSLTRNGFLNTEIINNTDNTIFYVSDTFLIYKKDSSYWDSLLYPDDYAKIDLGYNILPQKSIQLRLFMPLQKDYSKGKYKLQLVFRNASQDIYYYIDKPFLIK